LISSVKAEFKEFLKGFFQVVPLSIVSVFDEDELDFLMHGANEIDVADWQENTQYKGQYTKGH